MDVFIRSDEGTFIPASVGIVLRRYDTNLPLGILNEQQLGVIVSEIYLFEALAHQFFEFDSLFAGFKVGKKTGTDDESLLT